MKTIHKLSFIFLILIVNQACKQVEPDLYLDESLIGTWVYKERVPLLKNSDEYMMVYVHRLKFEKHDVGFSFLQSKQLVRRSYYGRCATPPMPISEFGGSWQLDGKHLNLKTTQWGLRGEETSIELKYEIITVGRDTLKLKIIP